MIATKLGNSTSAARHNHVIRSDRVESMFLCELRDQVCTVPKTAMGKAYAWFLRALMAVLILFLAAFAGSEGAVGKDGPFCQKCKDTEDKFVRLQDYGEGGWYCVNCRQSYDRSPPDAPGRIRNIY